RGGGNLHRGERFFLPRADRGSCRQAHGAPRRPPCAHARVNARAIAAGCLLASCVFAHAQTPEARLFEAIEEGKPLVAEGILQRGGVKLDARNAEQETPLHKAIEKDMRELGAMLVKAGAPMRAYSVLGETTLHAAALHADPRWVDLLLDAKADPNMRNDDGESALQWAVMT